MGRIKRYEAAGVGGAFFRIRLRLCELMKLGFEQLAELFRESGSLTQQPLVERCARTVQFLEKLPRAERRQLAARRCGRCRLPRQHGYRIDPAQTGVECDSLTVRQDQ